MIFAAIYSFSSKHKYKLKALSFSLIAMPDAYSTRSVNILKIFNAYQYRINKLDFCPNSFNIFRFSRSGERKVDVNRFMSKHSSDYNVLFCHDPLSHLSTDGPSQMKLMRTGTDSPRFDSKINLGTRR